MTYALWIFAIIIAAVFSYVVSLDSDTDNEHDPH